MRLRFLLWIGLVFLLEPAAAADIPFVFNESSNDVVRYDSDQLVNISTSSPELAGVPPISAPENSEILLFPASRTYKTVGEIKNELDYKVWQKKGRIFFSQGRYEEALQALDQSIKMNPRSAESWNERGNVLIAANRYNEALKCYEVAVALDPSFASAWINKAQALNAMDRYDEAVSACDKAIHLDPMSSDAWYTKALILEEEAQETFTKAKELAQNNQGSSCPNCPSIPVFSCSSDQP
jgi:tetratricopeptide (TPR) repeat protein